MGCGVLPEYGSSHLTQWRDAFHCVPMDSVEVTDPTERVPPWEDVFQCDWLILQDFWLKIRIANQGMMLPNLPDMALRGEGQINVIRKEIALRGVDRECTLPTIRLFRDRGINVT